MAGRLAVVGVEVGVAHVEEKVGHKVGKGTGGGEDGAREVLVRRGPELGRGLAVSGAGSGGAHVEGVLELEEFGRVTGRIEEGGEGERILRRVELLELSEEGVRHGESEARNEAWLRPRPFRR